MFRPSDQLSLRAPSLSLLRPTGQLINRSIRTRSPQGEPRVGAWLRRALRCKGVINHAPTFWCRDTFSGGGWQDVGMFRPSDQLSLRAPSLSLLRPSGQLINRSIRIRSPQGEPRVGAWLRRALRCRSFCSTKPLGLRASSLRAASLAHVSTCQPAS